MLRIGEFSRLAQVSADTLRYYDECALLRPVHTDRTSGYRYASIAQTYIAIQTWVEENRYRLDGPTRQVHLQYADDADPTTYVTELQSSYRLSPSGVTRPSMLRALRSQR